MTQDEIRTKISELDEGMADNSRCRCRLKTALNALDTIYMNMWKEKDCLERKLIPTKKLPYYGPPKETWIPSEPSPEAVAKKAVSAMTTEQMAEFMAALTQMGCEEGENNA